MSDIIIGKHTLESLTTGMYSDPFVVFREYIQNATDSIETAYNAGVLAHGEDNTTITLAPAERRIVIEDNGLGVPCECAERILVSIGNSQKSSDSDRGFRGIGRLSALSYCSKLSFETSFTGEAVATQVSFDARKLSELLMSDSGKDVSVVDVLKRVYTVKQNKAVKKRHYFRVIMEHVEESSGLTKYDDVFDYLSQNVPVPYSPEFSWGKEIVSRLKAEGHYERTYNICLSFGNRTTTIYKPYKDVFLVDKGKNISDRIDDINIVKIQQPNGELIAIGWTAKTNYLGSIYDRAIKGIRIRKGNIMIGDCQTMNAVFKDVRFNGWSIGEIFAIDTQLVPNARRDNFEKNTSYFYLYEQLMNIAANISKDIRSASLKRNAELAEAVRNGEMIIQNTDAEIRHGVSRSRKSAIKSKIGMAQDRLTASRPQNESDEYCQTIAFEKLDMLIGQVQGATDYKSINMTNSLNKAEKKILEQVFNVISKTVDHDTADLLVNSILLNFETHDKSFS